MMDDFPLSCKNEKTTRNIFKIIGEKIRFDTKKEKGIIPFDFLGVVNDYNDVDIR